MSDAAGRKDKALMSSAVGVQRYLGTREIPVRRRVRTALKLYVIHGASRILCS